jgi:hypothetical protein
MTTTSQTSRRELALIIITATVGVASTAFAVAAVLYIFAL